MLCFILSGALCYAHGEAQREERNSLSDSMSIVINGNLNMATFLENLENVSIGAAKSNSVLSMNILSTSINRKNLGPPLKSDTMFSSVTNRHSICCNDLLIITYKIRSSFINNSKSINYKNLLIIAYKICRKNPLTKF